MDRPSILLWTFALTVIIFLVLDLGFMNRSPKKISTKNAGLQSLFWVIISVLYGGLIYFVEDPAVRGADTLAYFSAYVTEKSLSVDNLFVILLILQFFKIDEKYYHKVLFWGILGAVVFRAIFIFTGAWLVGEFNWILYIFGAFLVYSGVKIFVQKENEEMHPEKSPVLVFFQKYFSIKTDYVGASFFLRIGGKLFLTPLFIALVLIETTDLIFAVDSIPAAFAITQDDFIIYTSNIFAVMGLRAMFFLLSSVLDKFFLLEKAISIVLIFIGAKMLLEHFIHIPTYISFVTIMLVLFGSIVLSLVLRKGGGDIKVPSDY